MLHLEGLDPNSKSNWFVDKLDHSLCRQVLENYYYTAILDMFIQAQN